MANDVVSLYNTVQLDGMVDCVEANFLLRKLLSSLRGDAVNHLFCLFIDKNAPYEVSALFNHAFVLTPRIANGAIDSVVGFRLLEAEEFSLTLRALYREKFVSATHGEIAPSHQTSGGSAEGPK